MSNDQQSSRSDATPLPYQRRVYEFMLACFGQEIAQDRRERLHRFLEESLELVQSLGCTREEALMLVDYTFGRPLGHPHQETGGVMVTLAALCCAHLLDMEVAGEDELTRVLGKMDVIREKQKSKPRNSPLPEAPRSERGAWIAVKDKLPDYKSPAENFVLGWFPGMNKPDVFSALTVRHWALDDDPIPGAIWRPLPALPAIPGERPDSQP